MVDELFLFGRPGGNPDAQLLDAFASVFDRPDIVLYVLGEPSDDYQQMVDRESIRRVIYDHEIDDALPDNPDISYLQRFESRLSTPNLWQAIVADRRLIKEGMALFYHRDVSPYSHDELLSHLEARIRLLEPIFEDHQFDLVYGQQIMYVGGMLSYMLARTHEVPFFRIATTRVSDRYTAQESIEERSPQIEAAFRKACSDSSGFSLDEARQHVRSVRKGGPLYTTPARGREGRAAFSPENVRKFVRNPGKYLATDYYYNVPAVQMTIARGIKRIRKWYLSKFGDFDAFDPDREYAYFPLQVQPELALMIRARYRNDFPAVVRNVAQSLPIGMELYVNEHPNMYGVREGSFYDRLRRLPNVRILDRSVSTADIVENASLTICINSTAGLESLFHDTPVVTLSDPSYVVMDSVQHASTWRQLTPCVRAAMAAGVDQEELVRYVAANLDIGISHNQSRSSYYEEICRQMRRSVRESAETAWRDALS
jgi:hypothetical protein